MGILNVTPDSFSEQGVNYHYRDAIDSAIRMMAEGADLIDVGGESTRPGAETVTVDEDLRRVLPVIEALTSMGIPVSIDTRKPDVARRALESGVAIVNDVTGMQDPAMMAICSQMGCTVCIMHMKGAPQTMQAKPEYEDVVSEVVAFLVDRANQAVSAGIAANHIWLDPGIGFGKTPLHNLQLLNQLPTLVAEGFPVLIGVSRKSTIGVIAGGAPSDQRLPGTLAAQTLAQAAGARIIRAHDVKEARQAIDVTAAILKPSSFSKHPA